METRGNIFNIQHFSLNDGLGIRTVVFFKGCPLNCIWCHNPESKAVDFELSFADEKCIMCKRCMAVCRQRVHGFDDGLHTVDRSLCAYCGNCVKMCPMSALDIIGKRYSADEVMAELGKDDIFYGEDGGITFSGGEPFMQFEFLYELLKACGEKGYSVCIETSGFTSADRLIAASELTDLFLFDYKETNPEKHRQFTGADNGIILENLALLEKLNKKVILRCPIIKGINDRAEHFDGIASTANKYDNILHIEVEPYHALGEAKRLALGKLPNNIAVATEKEKAEYIDAIQSGTNKKTILA